MPSCSPSITTMIRMDHTHVMAAFHRYHAERAWWRKRAIVELACTALEIHAQLEEEIFYPALSEVMAGDEHLTKSKPEHDKMREDIAKLRSMGPEDAAYDARFMQLMREAMHHVADEETVLLPTAERALASQLSELGMRMTKRRMQLVAQHRPGAIAANTVGTFPLASFALISIGALALAHCLRPASARRRYRA
ncbi:MULTISPECIES: hemerythrin domain-containing protein [unclassified Caballeronia]|uniref:hemerythrin domain-containing protein n=1 Tax=unclassified Caballeronia TaxID=2646786 RepID=UPI002866B1C8|nr:MULTISPECIES: hemerythrin domain-containing protein [unclassified Caballeronia]MDR5763161.1 hemerythrin domain-containing protein [Caballeronia sp. LZ035]MDR5883969.1 hemerythrin domain-containing protein [Caballeronia sp. LZ032]